MGAIRRHACESSARGTRTRRRHLTDQVCHANRRSGLVSSATVHVSIPSLYIHSPRLYPISYTFRPRGVVFDHKGQPWYGLAYHSCSWPFALLAVRALLTVRLVCRSCCLPFALLAVRAANRSSHYERVTESTSTREYGRAPESTRG